MLITENEKIENLFKAGIKTLTMHRINFGGKRLYCTTEPFKVYSGLTGALSAATFKGSQDAKRLDKWRDKMVGQLGQEGQQAYLQTMADFGTLVHEALVTIKENGGLDWKAEQEHAHLYFEASAKRNGIEPNYGVIRSQVFEYCKSAASLMQFVYEKVDEIYAIEGMAKSDMLEIATPIDLVCKLRDGIIASLNIKTSSQIGDHQLEQATIEKYLWNETYPDLQVNVTGIIRTKDWRKAPSYEFLLVTPEQEKEMGNDAFKRLKLVRENQNSTYLNYPKNIPIFTGETKAGEMPNIEYKTLEQIFNEQQTEI